MDPLIRWTPPIARAPQWRTLGCGLLLLLLPLLVCWLLWGDERTVRLALNTWRLASAVCLISLPLGTVPALLLFRTDVPGRRLAVGLLAAMLLVPLYLQCAGWDAGFGKQGWYSLWAAALAQPPLSGMRAAVWIHSMAAVPWVVLMVGVAVRRAEPELEEQALLEGGPLAVVRWVQGPRLLVALLVAGLWIVVSTAGEMTAADMYLVPTYARELYTGFALGDSAVEALVRVLPSIVLVSSLVLATLLAAIALAPPPGDSSWRPPRTWRLGPWRWPALLLVLLVLLLVVAVPLGNLVAKAGMVVRDLDGERQRFWSPVGLVQQLLASPARFKNELLMTLAVGCLTAGSTLLLAVPLAWWARRPGWRVVPGLLATTFGLAVPPPLVALGVIFLLDQPGSELLAWLYDDTLLAPVATLTVRALPLALLVLWAALRSVPADLLDAALVDGTGTSGRFFRVVLPLRADSLALAGMVALLIAAGDVAASVLVMPPGDQTVGLRVFGLIHAGVDDQVAALCLVSLLVYAAPAGALVWLAGRWLSVGVGRFTAESAEITESAGP
ncbi:MAG: iron ABC transporter permease [Pirellulaceae bacterium]|nr:iron ABC transporter permease [Pirellulaceae bacterium]